MPYIGAIFFYADTNALCSIEAINEAFATCEYLEEDLPPFRLSVQDVTKLIASFRRPRRHRRNL